MNAEELFQDRQTFQTIWNRRDIMEDIVSKVKEIENIEIYDGTLIGIYSGKREIFCANTSIGNITAKHNTGIGIGNSKGVKFRNKVYVTVEFSEKKRMADALEIKEILLEFLSMIIGAEQRAKGLHIGSRDGETYNDWRINECLQHKAKKSRGPLKPSYHDVLIDGVTDRNRFEHVLTKWMERDPEWREARARFSANVARDNIQYRQID